MPVVLVALFFILSLAAIILAAVGILVSARQDWAVAGVVAGLVAAILALIYLGVLVWRISLGRRALNTILLGLGAVVILGGLGASGLLLPQPLHRAQAGTFEASANWTGALDEYLLAGEHKPGSHTLARVHVEWGEALEHKGQYAAAITQYGIAITVYADATDEVHRAQAEDARAHFEYGTQLASQGKSADATTEFEFIAAHYPASSYAHQAHSSAATAYLALGKAQIGKVNCDAATSTYQALAANYADTPEGAQAKTALAAPVTVTGQLTHYPTNPKPTMYLSRSASGPGTYYSFSMDYSATLASDGSYAFHNVKQGSYGLAALLPDGSGQYWPSPSGSVIGEVVGPLCTDLGTRSYTQ